MNQKIAKKTPNNNKLSKKKLFAPKSAPIS